MKNSIGNKPTKHARFSAQGMSYIEPTQPKWFVSYPFIVAIMACLQVISTMYNRKFVDFLGFDISISSLLFLPIVIYIFQIVAECYGWQYARQIVWCNFIVNGLLTIITFLTKFIPYSTFNHVAMQNAYITLVDTMWVSSATGWLVIFLSDFISATLMCWSRFHWNGKFALLRTIIINLVSEMVLLSGSLIVLPFNGYSMSQTLHTMYNIWCARTIMCILILPIIRFIIWFIQHKVENVVVFDIRSNFNPFKFGINPTDSVHFNADGWDRIDSGKINLKKMAEYYSNGILEEQHQKMVESFNSREIK